MSGIVLLYRRRRLEIDNDIAERALRGVAVGRQNGLSPVQRRAASAPQRFTQASRPAKSMASTRRPTTPTSLGRSQLISERRIETSSCLELGYASRRAGGASRIICGLTATLAYISGRQYFLSESKRHRVEPRYPRPRGKSLLRSR